MFLSKRPRFFYGYIITFLAMLTYCAKSGILMYAAGPLVDALINKLNWKNTEIGFVFTVKGLVGLCSPLVGIAVVKWGPRSVLGYSGLIASILLGLTAFVTQPWQFALTYGIGLSIAAVFTQYITVFALVNNWWESKRGVMAGLVNGSGGIGQLIFVPLATWLLVTMDVKAALIWMAVILFLIGVLPQIIFVRNYPEQMGLKVDGGFVGEKKEEKPKRYYFSPVNWQAKDAIRTYQLWFIMLASCAGTWAFITFTVFGFTHLKNQGFSTALVATVMGAMGLTTIIGSLGAGFCIDRFGPKSMLIMAKVLLAIGYGLFMTVTSIPLLWVTIVILGVATGMNTPAVVSMLPSYFGGKNYASIQGSVMWLQAITSASSAFVSGWLADTTGSYVMSFAVSFVIILVGVLFASTVKPPKVPQSYLENETTLQA